MNLTRHGWALAVVQVFSCSKSRILDDLDTKSRVKTLIAYVENGLRKIMNNDNDLPSLMLFVSGL